MALILSHNCTLSIYPDMIRIKSPSFTRDREVGRRREIKEFSRASRKRLFEMMHQLIFERLSFVTLTYPATWPGDGKEIKKHLRRFRARIERKFGKLRVLWRMEYQKRGAPHFHLLLMDAPFICKLWLSKVWYQCVGSKDPKHFRYGTRIEAVAKKGENGKIAAYVGKYVGKVSEESEGKKHGWSGRYWGRWNVEKAIPIEVEIGFGEAVRVTAFALSARRSDKAYRPANATSCRVFGDRMGGSEFSRVVAREVREIVTRKRTGKLDS